MELSKKIRISNDLGLHARAAAKIVELGRRYKSQLFLRKDDREVDGSSILSILTLSCPKGTEIEARIVGEDSEAFMERLEELLGHKFGEIE
jgi:phosphocarrier protein